MVGLGRPADSLRLTNSSNGTGEGPGYNSFGTPPPPPAPEGEGLFPADKSDSDIGVADRSNDGDGIDGGRRDRGSVSGGGGRQAIVTAGLFVWAAVASLAAALLATSRGDLDASGDKGTAAAAAATATTQPTTRTSSPGSFATRTTASKTAAAAGGGGGGGGGGGSSGPKVNGNGDSNGNGNGKSTSWCLPNAAHQSFSGVVLKEDDGVMPQGEWEGEHWWYHDEITNGFHMAVTIGGDTYGFWDLGIIGAAGNTEYVAAYKGDRCLFYEEKVQPGSTPFDEDVTCRGSAWAGNVTLKEEVEFGYGTKAERWAGTIVDDEKNEYGGLPPGTESLVDLQRNPDDQGEVRLLYHRVVAPTNGVLGWASGDSLSFDLVFTNLDMMAANDVLDLVKVPSICEVMAGEFHDQQARDNAGGAGGGEGRERSRRALLPSPETTRSRTPASTSSLSLPSGGNEHTETGREESWPPPPRAAVAEEEGSENMHHPSAPLRTPAGRRREENRIIADGDIADGRRGGIGALGIGSEGFRNSGDVVGGGGGSRGGLRGLLAAVEQQEEQQEEQEEEGRGAEGGRGRSFVSGDDGRDDAWLTSPGGVPAGESDAYGEGGGRGGEGRPESEEAATAGLLPIHLLLRSLGRQGYRRRG